MGYGLLLDNQKVMVLKQKKSTLEYDKRQNEGMKDNHIELGTSEI
jgi:hypothetical protein